MLKYSIPDTTSKETVADWIELFVIWTSSTMSRSEASSYIREASGSDAENEFLVAVWSELESRVFLYGDTPPYKIASGLVEPNCSFSDCPEYVACLIWALEGNPHTTAANSGEAGKLFERISSEAARYYLNGNSVVYGYPSVHNIENIANNMLFEDFIQNPPASRNDRDLDVVAWKSFNDNRAGQVVLLMQCGAGKDWTSKTKELSLDAWKSYIHFGVTPLRAFSMPVIITDKRVWFEHSVDGGLLMDRSRLYKFTFAKTFSDAGLRSELSNWCDERIRELSLQ
jgi:hypothetical protein